MTCDVIYEWLFISCQVKSNLDMSFNFQPYVLLFLVGEEGKRCTNIVFVLSQYDGGNIEQWTIGYGCHQNQRSQAKDCGRRLNLDPTNKILIQPFTI